MEEDEKHIRFDRYLRQEMSEPERSAFEAELEQDPALSEDFESFRMTKALLEIDQKQRIKSMVKDMAAQRESGPAEEETPVKSINGWRKFRIAAAVLILLTGALTSLYVLYVAPRPQALATEYFEPYDGSIRMGSGNSTTDQLKQELMAQYQKQEYDSVISGLSDPRFNDDYKAQFYLGISYLATEQYGAATPVFERLNTVDFEHSADVKINLALAYLGQSKVEEATKVLDEIIATGVSDNGYPRAVLLLEELQ